MEERKGAILNRSFGYAVVIVNLCKKLVHDKEFVLSKQLLRSGTGVGALIREAQNAESKADFIHKLGVAQKECDETPKLAFEIINKLEWVFHLTAEKRMYSR